MKEDVSHAELLAQIAALKAATETELKDIGRRLGEVEKTQKEVVRVTTQGGIGVRIFLGLAAFIVAAGATIAAWLSLGNRAQ